MKEFLKKICKNNIFKICLISLLIVAVTTFLVFYFKIWLSSSYIKYDKWWIPIIFCHLMIYFFLVIGDIFFIITIILLIISEIWELIKNKKNKSNENNVKQDN